MYLEPILTAVEEGKLTFLAGVWSFCRSPSRWSEGPLICTPHVHGAASLRGTDCPAPLPVSPRHLPLSPAEERQTCSSSPSRSLFPSDPAAPVSALSAPLPPCLPASLPPPLPPFSLCAPLPHLLQYPWRLDRSEAGPGSLLMSSVCVRFHLLRA